MFFIPYNDIETNRYTSLPFMTLAIIIVNTLLLAHTFLMMLAEPYEFERFIYLYGSIPTLILSRQGGGALSGITHMFLHGGIFHLFSNMLGLWVFGRRVEDACGPWRYLVFYLVCGVFADIVSTMTRVGDPIPGIGASGALFGLMGAYLILYPRGRIRIFLLILLFRYRFTLRAYWVILYFLVFEFISGFQVLFADTDFQVLHWAHLGGFFASMFIFLFLRPDAFHRYRNDLPL